MSNEFAFEIGDKVRRTESLAEADTTLGDSSSVFTVADRFDGLQAALDEDARRIPEKGTPPPAALLAMVTGMKMDGNYYLFDLDPDEDPKGRSHVFVEEENLLPIEEGTNE